MVAQDESTQALKTLPVLQDPDLRPPPIFSTALTTQLGASSSVVSCESGVAKDKGQVPTFHSNFHGTLSNALTYMNPYINLSQLVFVFCRITYHPRETNALFV